MKNSRGSAMARACVCCRARKIKYMEKVRGSLKSRAQGEKNRVYRGGGVVEKLKSSPGEEKYGGQ